MGEVDRQTSGGVHGGKRGIDVSRYAEVAGVHVQGEWHREIVQCARQRGEYRARRHPVMRVRFIDVELARVELECADTSGIDHLDAYALRGMQRPRHVVVDEFLVRARSQQLQQEVIVAEQGVAALVYNRRVAHFHVRLSRIHGQDRRFETGGVAHFSVAVAGGKRRRRSMAAAGTGQRSTREGAVAVIFRQHGARDIDLAPADVGMNVYRTGHDDAPGQIDFAIDARPCRRCCDDATGIHEQVAHFAIDPVGRVVDPSAPEPDHGCFSIVPRIMRSASAAEGSVDSASLRTPRATTLSVRNRCPA